MDEQEDGMTIVEIHGNLCCYDSRNQDHWYDPDWYDEPPTPRVNCACDNCFYGLDELALEILRLREIIEQLQ